MKLVEKAKRKKQNIKHRQIDKSKKGQVLIVAQEIKFARLLSGNEKKSRDRVLKTLKKWLSSCFHKGYDFKEDDFTRVWKGLFYAVWMSDKPLVQEELCDNIAGILELFPNDQFKHAIMMIKAGLRVLATEWFGIDQHRMDKFMMLVRRFLRGSLGCLQRCNWDVDNCKMYSKMLSSSDGILAAKTPHYARNATSMLLHFIDCFLEEVSKVSSGEIPDDSLVELLHPFIAYMNSGECPTLVVRARRVLTWLLRQSSLGLAYQDATRAWHQMGCPEGGPEALELVSDEEEDVQNGDGSGTESDEEQDPRNKPLDPRAGRVDVELNPLPVPAEKIAAALREQLRSASSKAHKRIKIFMQRFEKLAKEEYPLAIPRSDWSRNSGRRISAQKSATKLLALDSQLKDSSDELALRGLSRKHRKRLLAMSRAGVNIADEVEKMRQNMAGKEQETKTNNGGWQVEEAEPEAKKTKLNEKKNLEQKEKPLERKRKEPSTDNTANKKLKTEEKGKKDVGKKVKDVILNGAEGKDSVVGVTSSKKLKVQPKVKKDITDTKDSKETIKTKVQEKSGNNVVNGINKKKLKKSPKVIKDNTEKEVTHKVNKKQKPIVNGVHKHENNKSPDKKLGKDKPIVLVNKVKNFQKSTKKDAERKLLTTPKKVKFVLKNNSMQGAVDYYKSVRQSPNIPYNPSKKPTKTNLKPSTPSPINPFFKKKLKLK
ncbi:ribosomal RNA processing protein 1 homolog [Manduca sexta]|uniref:ribosomal RNA processing protein 1 homolog n=1 Tax=Manduca sexta TaxID=7130 RepID=UPI00188F51AD|nr:ribosomal RNA processing protein 1 homolog [Manduca sexta]